MEGWTRQTRVLTNQHNYINPVYDKGLGESHSNKTTVIHWMNEVDKMLCLVCIPIQKHLKVEKWKKETF